MAIAFDNTVVIVLNVIFEKITKNFTKGIAKAQE
jgi:hypothetical protein